MLAVALPAPDVPDSLSAPFHLADRSVTVKSIVLLAYFLFVMCFQKSRSACRSYTLLRGCAAGMWQSNKVTGKHYQLLRSSISENEKADRWMRTQAARREKKDKKVPKLTGDVLKVIVEKYEEFLKTRWDWLTRQQETWFSLDFQEPNKPVRDRSSFGKEKHWTSV